MSKIKEQDMKKYLILFTMLIPCSGFAETVRLNCNSGSHTYNVIVDFIDQNATISVDGTQYDFISEYDTRAAYYTEEPWMRLEVGNHRYQAKYTFAAIVNTNGETGPLYMPCTEITE